MMECHHCQAANPDGKRYCGECGAQLTAPSLREQIDAALNARLKDQKVVEVEVTEAIVNRLTGWAKMLAYLIGVPLVLLGSALGFLGVKTYLDFSTLSKQAASRVAEFEQMTARQDEALRKRAEGLKAGFADIEKELEQTKALSSRVESLTKEVRQIREKVGFEQSSALTPPIQKELEASIYQFQAYMERIGYRSKEGVVKVHIDPKYKSNTIYNLTDHSITLAENIMMDRHSLLYTYMMHVLQATNPSLTSSPNSTVGAVSSGLGDYFSASFLNDPRISPVLAKELSLKQPYIRTLENKRRFDDQTKESTEVHARGETWGGAFWEIRGLVGQEATDRLLFKAWTEWRVAGDSDASFARTLIGLSSSGNVVRDVFVKRGLAPGPQTKP